MVISERKSLNAVEHIIYQKGVTLQLIPVARSLFSNVKDSHLQ